MTASYRLMEHNDWQTDEQCVVVLEYDVWHAWRETTSGSATVSGRVWDDDTGRWSEPRLLKAFALDDLGRRFRQLPSQADLDACYDGDAPFDGTIPDLHLDALSREAVTVYEDHLSSDAATARLVGAVLALKDALPADLVTSAVQGAMFHRHQAVLGAPPPGENFVAEAVAGMRSKRAMEDACDSPEARCAAALLRLVLAVSKGARAPGWAEEVLMEDGEISYAVLDDLPRMIHAAV